MNDYEELIADLRHYFYDTELVLDAIDAIEQLVKERNEAVADLKELATCDYCKWFVDYDCTDFEHEECHGNHWKWRGAQEG